MSYQMPPDLENEFSLRLSKGDYANMDHILRSALSALDSRDLEVAAIQEGIDAVERGEVRSFDEFDRELRVKKNIPLDA